MIKTILILILLMPSISEACRLLDASKHYPEVEMDITFIKECPKSECKGGVRGIGDRKQCIGHVEIEGKEEIFFLLDFDCKGDKRIIKVLKPTNPCHSQMIEVRSESS